QRRSHGRISTRVIRNGIDIAHFSEPAKAHKSWREKLYQAADDEIIALQVGRISLQKQQHVSVEALIRLQASGLKANQSFDRHMLLLLKRDTAHLQRNDFIVRGLVQLFAPGLVSLRGFGEMRDVDSVSNDSRGDPAVTPAL